MIRSRFYLPNAEDWRPVEFPPPSPYWCTGFVMDGDDDRGIPDTPVIVAYTETKDQITEFWPEAFGIEVFEHDCRPEFTERFPRPEWWTADLESIRAAQAAKIGESE